MAITEALPNYDYFDVIMPRNTAYSRPTASTVQIVTAGLSSRRNSRPKQVSFENEQGNAIITAAKKARLR